MRSSPPAWRCGRSPGEAAGIAQAVDPPPRILHAGEAALVVEFGATAARAHHDRVLALDGRIAAAPPPGITETVPTYRSLMVHFDPGATDASALRAALVALAAGPGGAEAGDAPPPSIRRWLVPACYDPPHGEDLREAAGILGLAPERAAALHAGTDYRVVMYGFAPGFAFLDGLPAALGLSRRPSPRPPAAPGALTVANGQALIASVAMPTGWYVLGRTPARLFDPARDPIFPLGVGDAVRFERVDAEGFAALERRAAAGEMVARRG